MQCFEGLGAFQAGVLGIQGAQDRRQKPPSSKSSKDLLSSYYWGTWGVREGSSWLVLGLKLLASVLYNIGISTVSEPWERSSASGILIEILGVLGD